MEIVATSSLSFIQSLISFLPEGGTFPQELHDSAVILGGYLATVNAFLPVDTAIACFTLVYSVTIASWGTEDTSSYSGSTADSSKRTWRVSP